MIMVEMGSEASKLAVGRDTFSCAGDGDGVGVGTIAVAVAVAVAVGVAGHVMVMRPLL